MITLTGGRLKVRRFTTDICLNGIQKQAGRHSCEEGLVS
jgi:hypothetical protein